MMEELTIENVYEVLKTVIDPELNVNIIDLGLVYDVGIQDDHVEVTMTMTTRGCPMHNAIVGGVEQSVLADTPAQTIHVNVVWEPAWTPVKMSDAAKEQLGFF